LSYPDAAIDAGQDEPSAFDADLPTIFLRQTYFSRHRDLSCEHNVALRERRILINGLTCQIKKKSNALMGYEFDAAVHTYQVNRL